MWKIIFRLKSIINIVQAIIFWLFEPFLRQAFGQSPLVNVEYAHLFLSLVIVLGIGYWWVGDNPNEHRDIIKLGIYGQISAFIILVYHVYADNIKPVFIVPGIFDIIFATLYIIFLVQNPILTDSKNTNPKS